jgi:cell division protein FtsL
MNTRLGLCATPARVLVAFLVIIATFAYMPHGAFASEESDQARREAQEILKSEEYQEDEGEKPLSEDVERISRWLGDGRDEEVQQREEEQVQEQQSSQNDSPSFTPPATPAVAGIGPILLWFLIFVIVAALGFLIYKIISTRTPKEEDDEEIVHSHVDIDWTDEELVLETISDADHLEKLSDQAERAGRFDVALRYRFRAGLLRLNDKNAIAFHPSVTNAQWQLTINNPRFTSLVRDFDDVTYGKHNCDYPLVTKAKSEWSALLSEKRAGSQS